MKKIFYMVLPAALLSGCSPFIYTSTNPQPVYQQPIYADQPQTSQVFYDELSPYGQWIDYPGDGYVWQPNADADFRPYVTNGYWVYSDDGWAWVSNYSWGWAPFHYGNWFFDDNYGWLWEPGQQWAPAWVTWGQSGDYYGWAPVPPHTDMNGGWRPQNRDWNFVRARNINTTHVNNYVVRNNVNVINNTTIINNVTNNNITNNYVKNSVIYNRGPRINEVENITNTKIQQVRISAAAKPGQSLANNQLNVYRPVINQGAQRGNNRAAPQKFTTYRQGDNSGQVGNQTPNQNNPNQRQGDGRGNNQTPNHTPNNYQNPNGENKRQGYGQQNNQNQNPNNQNQRQGYGQENNQNQNPNYQNQRQGNGRGNNQNPNQGNQNPDNKPVMGQNPNMPLINRSETVMPKHGNGQGNNLNQQRGRQNPNQPNNGNNNNNPNLQQGRYNPGYPANTQGNNQNLNKPPFIINQKPNPQQFRPGQVPNQRGNKMPQPKKQTPVPPPPAKPNPDKPQNQ